jgi:hypothetical protein
VVEALCYSRKVAGSSTDEVLLCSVLQLLVTADVFPSSLILSTLIMEAIRSFETSVLTRGTRHRIPGVRMLHSHRRENLKPHTD